MAITPTTGPISSPGIASGLDVNTIIAKLMAVEQQPLVALAKSEAGLQARISAYGALKGSLAALQTAVGGLKDAQDLSTLAAAVGDPTVATATTGNGAVPGSYALQVTQLAQAQKIASAGFTKITDTVGTGTLTFSFGTFDGASFALNGTTPTRTVSIGAGQNSLAGIRDAVNAANVGVTATIVNDGSAQGNRLVFTSNTSGAANSLKVTVDDSDSNDIDTTGLSQLAYDPTALAGSGKNLTQKVAAQNALLTIDGISVSKSSNVINDAIQGVTLNLLKTNVGLTTQLTVANDTSGITKAVQSFVKAYNDLGTQITNLTKYNPDTRTASTLTGDSATRSIQNQLRTIVGGAIPQLSGSLATLAQVGVSFAADGTLSVDTAKLGTAIAGNAAAVARVFAAVGAATDSLLTVNATGTKATPGTYGVAISQLATRGNVVGSGAAALTITAGVNDRLDITVDGTTATVTLAAKTYGSAAELADEVQATVNGATAFIQNNSGVTVTAGGGVLTITSNRYGSASAVNVAGIGASDLVGGSPTKTAGVDVAGTIGGITARGSGQILTGAIGSATEGLQLQVSGGSTGARGNVTYTQGFAYQLDTALTGILNATGVIQTRTDGANKSIADIDNRRDALTLRLQQVEANYRRQFQALDTLLSSMSATSTFLTQQLANLPKSES